MAIKIYGIPPSTAAARVLAALHEKELEYELIPTDTRTGEHKKESFLAINPFGQIPALEDGDLKLFESRAITNYIAHAYADKGNQLVTEDPKKMAMVGVWMEVEAHKFDTVASKLVYELVMYPLLGKPTNEEAVKENEEKLNEILDIYEARLTQSKYLGGDTFTIADLHHLPVVSYLMMSKAKALFDARPHVSAWRTAILARPSWSKVVELQQPFFAPPAKN